MITITPTATAHLRALLGAEPAHGAGLRLAVERGGCAGLQYSMKVDQATPTDHVYESNGVAVIVDPASAAYLAHSEVDYVDTLADTGFKIRNPNAARSCGCGTSFEPAVAGEIAPRETVPDGTCRD
jgi:iron-sulfur cluster assembly accessory protein